MVDTMAWQTAAKQYLERLGRAEYQTASRARKGKRLRSFTPSEYMCDLIVCLNRNDEEAFKARKMLEGYASAAGV